ncbi:hypothetical protein BDV29DRAFT_150460 [Aspergillus leporis]|uniref:Uncharacterized protein n=1 Tax=Aspergillus leporis TaxID=41062 RepID=A0A5N5WVH2_9EURO|nr:hypothetical protein BDV29DRAFT_150460 [Aspergillus leporis]
MDGMPFHPLLPTSNFPQWVDLFLSALVVSCLPVLHPLLTQHNSLIPGKEKRLSGILAWIYCHYSHSTWRGLSSHYYFRSTRRTREKTGAERLLFVWGYYCICFHARDNEKGTTMIRIKMIIIMTITDRQ